MESINKIARPPHTHTRTHNSRPISPAAANVLKEKGGRIRHLRPTTFPIISLLWQPVGTDKIRINKNKRNGGNFLFFLKNKKKRKWCPMSESETPFPGRHERGSTTNRKTLCVVQQRRNNNNNNNVSHDIYNQNITYSGWGGKEPGVLLFACKRIGYKKWFPAFFLLSGLHGISVYYIRYISRLLLSTRLGRLVFYFSLYHGTRVGSS